MIGQASGVGGWTRHFAAASATALVGHFAAVAAGVDRRAAVLLGLLGFVCLMVFGMGYLLLPPYLGRTLADDRLPGVHLAVAVPGLVLLVADRAVDAPAGTQLAGALLWSAGVLVFVLALGATVARTALRREDDEATGSFSAESSTPARLAILAALAYLAVGTLGLLSVAGLSLGVDPPAAGASHYYAAGFAALLVFALGARLLPGFAGVEPPRRLQTAVLVAATAAPALLGQWRWTDPWFEAGAALEGAAVLGYAGVVAVVVSRTDRSRVGFAGVALGAAAGVVGVASGVLVVSGAGGAGHLSAHVALLLGGFFPLTVVGYAVLFFPVTGGQFPGATRRGVAASTALLAAGAGLQWAGALWGGWWGRPAGAVVSLCGAVGYWYLLVCRLYDA